MRSLESLPTNSVSPAVGSSIEASAEASADASVGSPSGSNQTNINADAMAMSSIDTGPLETEYSIGELAREFDLTLRTLRFYEDKGLLRPRRVGIQRIYSRRDRARLKLIVMGKKVGFSLQDIGAMLDLYDLKDGQPDQLQTARDRFLDQIAVLEKQKQDIEQAIGELERTVEVVTGMLKAKQAN